MKENDFFTRRKFIKQSSVAGVGLLLPVSLMANSCSPQEMTSEKPLNVSIFSKCLQFLNYRDTSEAVKEMGFDGIDWTIRPKGHVLPESVAETLPQAAEAMKSFGLAPDLFTTNVRSANDPVDKKLLETTSQLGFKTYRTAWFKYKKEEDILEKAQFAKTRLTELAQLNKKLNLVGGYQNHSGNYFGSGIWDLYEVLKDFSPQEMGSQYDLTHAMIDGGRNWEVGFKLLQPFINSIALKDFIWKKKDGKWKVTYVPMGEGMVDFKRFFSLLKKHQIQVPFTIHAEYDLGGAEHGRKPTMDQKLVLGKIKNDLDFLRRTYTEVE